MNPYKPPTLTRREVIRQFSAVAGAGLLGLGSGPAAAEPPLETRSIRLLHDPGVPVLCYAPQYLAKEFLHLEGFEDVTYVGYGDAISDYEVLRPGQADITAGLGSDHIFGIDSGAPITILGGLHAGCVEVFGNDQVRSIRDLKGKRIAIFGMGGPEHIFLSTVISYIGLDPTRDVDWVVDKYGSWPELLAENKVDVVSAFPPQNLAIREMNIGHVILNTTIDEPWRNFFCCMVAARQDYVRNNPVATKRAYRAILKANQLCDTDKELAARLLVERGATDRYDYALTTLNEVPYGAWRDYDPVATMRFFSLNLREAGLVKSTPSEIIARGSDFRFLEQIRRELKV